jgi:multidrug resistance efflux pump
MAGGRWRIGAVPALLRDRLTATHVHVAVWVAAAGLVGYMLAGRARTFEYVGIAQALQHEVSPGVPGTVSAILVDAYEAVEPGQIVARLDDRELAARLVTERVVIEQLAAELGAERARVDLQEASLVTDRRRFQIDEQRLYLEILSLRVVLESDRIEAERLNLQAERSQALGAQGILSQAQVDDLRLQRDAVERRIAETARLLDETEKEHRATGARRVAYERRYAGPARDPLLEPLRAGVRAQERRVEEIEIQRRGLTLRSPVAGRVSQVLARSGQHVLPGEPVVYVQEEAVWEIVAYAVETSAGPIAAHAPVQAMRRGFPSVLAESAVTRVGATIEVLPQRLWRDPATPEYGLPFVIAAVPELRLRPGELVTVRIPQR